MPPRRSLGKHVTCATGATACMCCTTAGALNRAVRFKLWESLGILPIVMKRHA